MPSTLASIPIIDSHVHFVHPERMGEMLSLMDAVPCARFNLVSIPNPDTTTHNPAALYFKQHHPDRAYISGALEYSVLADPSQAPARLAAQIAALKAQGFDGLKLIEGKPQVRRMIPYPLDPDNVHVGPSDYVPWLTDRKWCYLRMEGTTFGEVPLNVEVKLEVWDSPNSAGVMIDAIRCAKLALDRGLSGAIIGPSSYFFKTPPRQFRDDLCREKTEAFIRGENNE
jgi:hypothetical protein